MGNENEMADDMARACFDRGVEMARAMSAGQNIESAAYIGGLATGLALHLSEMLGDEGMREAMRNAAETAVAMRAEARAKGN